MQIASSMIVPAAAPLGGWTATVVISENNGQYTGEASSPDPAMAYSNAVKNAAQLCVNALLATISVTVTPTP